jgi:hypothetical protein
MAMDTTITTQIAGIPCQLRVTYWEATTTATWYTPAEGGDIEYEVLDRRGYPAPWLERKLTDLDRQRLEVEINAHFRKGARHEDH